MTKHTETTHSATHGKHTESYTHEALWSSATAAAKSLFNRTIEVIPGKVEHVSLSEMRDRPSPGSMWGAGSTEHGEFVFYPSNKGSATLAPVCWEDFSFSSSESLRDSDGKVYTAVVREEGPATIRVVTVDVQRD